MLILIIIEKKQEKIREGTSLNADVSIAGFKYCDAVKVLGHKDFETNRWSNEYWEVSVVNFHKISTTFKINELLKIFSWRNH